MPGRGKMPSGGMNTPERMGGDRIRENTADNYPAKDNIDILPPPPPAVYDRHGESIMGVPGKT